MSMWGFYGPSAQGLMTRRVGPTEQGKLQGALSSIMGITGIVGPAMFTLTFSGGDQHLETLVPHRRAVPAGVRAAVGGGVAGPRRQTGGQNLT